MAEKMLQQLQEALNVHCPNCHQVFPDRTEEDMEQCLSLECTGCGHRVCGLCLLHRTDDVMQSHQHVRNCLLNPTLVRRFRSIFFFDLKVCEDRWALRRLIQVESVKTRFHVHTDHGQAGQVYKQLVENSDLDLGTRIFNLRRTVLDWYNELQQFRDDDDNTLKHYADRFFFNNSIDFRSFFSN